MFFLLPLEYRHARHTRKPPIANTILIVINVILFGLGWSWVVGTGSGILSVFMYRFSHVSFWHLLINMWFLWVFGNPVNRRLGNGYYLLGYLGTILVMGVLARLFLHTCLAGSSGAVCAVITIALLLMPAAILEVAYLIFFPLTILLGLLRLPQALAALVHNLGDGVGSSRLVLGLDSADRALVALLERMELGAHHASVWHVMRCRHRVDAARADFDAGSFDDPECLNPHGLFPHRK